MPHERVKHCQREPYFLYIGRGPDPNTGRQGPDWGNPFKLGAEADTREEAVALHRAWVLQRPYFVDRIRSQLPGIVLGCWCAPRPCHGDTLAGIADTAPVPHENVECSCRGQDHPCTRCQGLYVCRYCGGAEGALTSECPRTRTGYDANAVYAGRRNYICGEWVDGCYDEEQGVTMPCWAGRVHTVEGGR